MSTWIEGAWDIFQKLSPVPMLAIGIAALIVLFLPTGMAAWLGLDELRSRHLPYISGACLVAWLYLGASSAYWIGKRISSQRKSRRIRLEREKYLQDLTPEEKAYLIPYIREDQTTISFSLLDGVAGTLIAKQILYIPVTMGHIINGAPHSIRTWAKDYLRSHPDLLEGAAPPPLSPREQWDEERRRR